MSSSPTNRNDPVNVRNIKFWTASGFLVFQTDVELRARRVEPARAVSALISLYTFNRVWFFGTRFAGGIRSRRRIISSAASVILCPCSDYEPFPTGGLIGPGDRGQEAREERETESVR